MDDCPNCECLWNIAPSDEDGEMIGYRCPACDPPLCPHCNHSEPGFIQNDWELLWLCPGCLQMFREEEVKL